MQTTTPQNPHPASESHHQKDVWSAYMERNKLKEAWVDWIEQYAPWQTACCWHLPNGYRAAQDGWSRDTLSSQMKKYFEAVERRAFKHSPQTAPRKIKRFITNEYSSTVGWHAHGLLATPAHYTDIDFRQLLRSTWVDYYARYNNPNFAPQLIYLEDLRGKYIGYAVKSAIQVHESNSHNNAANIDLENCRL